MRKGFTLVELLVVIVIISLLAALLLPALVRALCLGKQGAAQARVDQLSQATQMYYTDNAAYPENGPGSTTLSLRLQQLSSQKLMYVEFKPGDLDLSGSILSPLPGAAILYYQNNRLVNAPNPNPATWVGNNKQSFDIWTVDCGGDPQGIRNW
jgi:prepilin-type N-terminal cleavage/methylation domain-containing protein